MHIIQNPLMNSESICLKCKHLLRRLILPLDIAQFNINIDNLDLPEDEEIILEHCMCKEVLLDLDHVVIECNKFKPKIKNSLLRNKF